MIGTRQSRVATAVLIVSPCLAHRLACHSVHTCELFAPVCAVPVHGPQLHALLEHTETHNIQNDSHYFRSSSVHSLYLGGRCSPSSSAITYMALHLCQEMVVVDVTEITYVVLYPHLSMLFYHPSPLLNAQVCSLQFLSIIVAMLLV